MPKRPPPKTESQNPHLGKTEAAALETIILRLEALCDEHSTHCGVSIEAKKEAAIYVNTWITPYLLELFTKPASRSFWLLSSAAEELPQYRRWKREAEARKTKAENHALDTASYGTKGRP